MNTDPNAENGPVHAQWDTIYRLDITDIDAVLAQAPIPDSTAAVNDEPLATSETEFLLPDGKTTVTLALELMTTDQLALIGSQANLSLPWARHTGPVLTATGQPAVPGSYVLIMRQNWKMPDEGQDPKTPLAWINVAFAGADQESFRPMNAISAVDTDSAGNVLAHVLTGDFVWYGDRNRSPLPDTIVLPGDPHLKRVMEVVFEPVGDPADQGS